MEDPVSVSEERSARRELLESLSSLGAKGYGPGTLESSERTAARKELSSLVERTSTIALLPALNILIQPGRATEELRAEFMKTLAVLPVRQDGVRATLEFVFAVHPSSAVTMKETATPHKEGANITHEALKMAAKLLASPPSTVSAEQWFKGLAPQLLALLDGQEGIELAKVAAYVIGFGILGRRSFGAPGTPGWNCFAEPMLCAIDPTVRRTPQIKKEESGIVTLGRNATSILVSGDDLSQGLRRLQTLVISHPNPGLTRRLLGPILLPLWALSSWSNANKHCDEEYGLPARNLLKIYLKITTAADKATPIIRNLLYNGSRDPKKQPQWAYQTTSSGNDIRVVSAEGSGFDEETLPEKLAQIGPKADALLDLLTAISSGDDDVSLVFLDLFGRWLANRRKSEHKTQTVLVKEEEDVDAESSLADVTEGTILQKMMERFPEKLAENPGHILELVQDMLQDLNEQELEADESVPILLSLLNLVITAPNFRRANADEQVVKSIEASLQKIVRGQAAEDTNKTAQNLLLFLQFRDELDDDDAVDPTGANHKAASAEDKQRAEDRKTYRLALSYITTADAPPPVRSEGLSLLQDLLKAHSPVLDIPSLLVLLSSLLDDPEDYINLRVVQMFSQVADRHPQATTRELLDHYVDARETKSVDTRLRFGEALLQVIQRLGATFTGPTAEQVGTALLETAGRRSQRPKTAAKQARDARRRKTGPQKQGGGDEDEEDEEDELEGLDDKGLQERKERNAILGGIVAGWGSREGTEDIRIRASALSVLATAIDTNVAGLGPTLTSSAVDLCLHVLTMETGLSTAILRRAAIVLILRFVWALHNAREQGRRLGFGLAPQSQTDILRVLKYVSVTDADGLVQQHARDVVESLENWQLASVVPSTAERVPEASIQQQASLPRLAGLSLDPASSIGSSVETGGTTANKRPRIEEIE